MIRITTKTGGNCLLLAGLVLAVPWECSVWGQESLTADSPNQFNAERSIADRYDSVEDQFLSGRFSTRQQATWRAWKMRNLYRDQVKKAAENSDPEVASRARWILNQWRRGISPDTPPKERRVLQGDLPEAIQELLEQGRFQAAIDAVEDSTDVLEFGLIKEHLSSAISLRFPFYIQQAVENETVAEFLHLIDIVATSSELAVCRVRMMQKLGVQVDDDSLLPTTAKDWPPGERELARVAVLSILGRHDDAIAEAADSVHADLLRITLMMNGRWEEFIKTALQSAEDAEPNSPEQVGHWTDVLFAADQSGDQATKQKAIDRLLNMDLNVDAKDVTSRTAASLINSPPFGRRWKALVMYGHLQDTVDLLKDDFPDDVTRLLLVASRPELAMDALGFPIGQVDVELDDWIQEAIDAQLLLGAQDSDAAKKPVAGRRSKSKRLLIASDSPCHEISRILALARCLMSVGRTLEARRIVDVLCETDIQFSYDERTLRDYVILAISTTEMRTWLPELAVFPGERSSSYVATWCVANRTLSNMDDTTFNLFMGAMQTLRRNVAFDERFAMVCELLDGRVPEDFDPKQDFKRLYDHLAGTEKSFALKANPRFSARKRINRTVVDFFAMHGQTELADKCMRQLIGSDMDVVLEIAIQAADSGEATAADLYFDAIWDQAKAAGRQKLIARFTDEDAARATKAKIAHWVLMQREDDREQAELAGELIQWTLCSPSVAFLTDVVTELASRGEPEMARDTLQVLLPLAALGVSEKTELYDVAYDYLKLSTSEKANPNDPSSALQWLALAVNETYEDTHSASMSVVLPMLILTRKLEAAIEAGDASECDASMEKIMKLDRLDISVAEDLLPKMRKAGMVAIADKYFDRIFEDGKEHAALFPQDSRTANNVAWVAAMNHIRLDEALVLSKQSVYFEPDSAVYRDTLAELLFQLDRKKEALSVEESCLLDDPSDWHTHVQVRKYQDAVLAE